MRRSLLIILSIFFSTQIVAGDLVKWPDVLKIDTKDKKIQILDVRSPEEYKNGYFAGAKLFNIHDPMFKAWVSELKPDVTYYLYCHSGNRSHYAQEYMLKNIKNAKIKDIAGGITSCKKLAACQSKIKIPSGKFTY